MKSQVRYSAEAQRGYIYFEEPLKLKICCTRDLDEAHEFLLDFDKKWRIVGIELEGEAARKISAIDGQSHVFQKKTKANGKMYYAFRLTDQKVKKTITHPKANAVHFLFADTVCKDFIGINIYNIEAYAEQYLVGE